MSVTLEKSTRIPAGTTVQVVAGEDGTVRYCDHIHLVSTPAVTPGAILTVLDGPDHQDDYSLGNEEGTLVGFAGTRHVVPFHVEPEATEPTVLVGLLEKETSRRYAANAITRVNPPWANDVLRRAADGLEFDVVEFNHALAYAFSTSATRHEHSMKRREAAKEVRHLAHWANAKIDAAVKGLEPIEPGARSPRIAELSDEVSRLEDLKSSLLIGLDEAERKVKALEAERDAAETAAGRAADLAEQYRDLAQQRVVREVYDYALGLLDSADQARVQGFIDGLRRTQA